MADERNEYGGSEQRSSWGRPEDIRVPGGGLFGDDGWVDPDDEWSDYVEDVAEDESAAPRESSAAGADGGVTGNGRYYYADSDPFGEDYSREDEQYAHARQGGSLRYGEDDYAGRGAGNRRGQAAPGNGGRKPAKGRWSGKAILAVALAAVFGLCAGLGAWGAGSMLSESEKKAGITESRDQDTEEGSAEDYDAENSGETDEEEYTEQAVEEVTPQFVTGSGDAPSNDIVDVAEFVMPSIVSVYNNYISEEYYFGRSYQQEATSTGSGIIIATTDTELLIVTNNHVVAGTQSLKVRFIDNTEAEANLKGTDEANDLAVIAVLLETLSAETQGAISVATLGNSETLRVGQDAIAIGNALGYGQSVTRGIVSAVNREIADESGITGTFIQTDAAINPGNSGGALVDINGEVIGINSSKIGGDTVEGMGFAIPISEAKPIIEELMNQQTKRKVASDNQGTLGISGTTVTSEAQVYYGLPGGVYVSQILEGGAAADSELEKGDVITGINGTPIKSMEALKKQLQYYEAGTTVTLTIQRRGSDDSFREMTIDFTLGNQEILNDAQQELGEPQEQQEEQEGDTGGLFDGQRPDTGRGFDFSGDGNGREFGWPFGGFGEEEDDGK